MAPEQLDGEPPDPRADQFAFCVSLFEALHGARPFDERSREALQRSIRAGDIRRPASAPALPAWVDRIIARGLSVDPGDRFASMREVVAALEADPLRRRRRIVLGVAGVSLVGSAGYLLAVGGTPSSPCPDASVALDGVWDSDRAASVLAAFEATELAYAERSALLVVSRLDSYAQDWVAMRSETCEATRLRGEQSESMLDLRMACLDRRRAELDALARVLSSGGAEIAARGAQAASGLTPLQVCADVDALAAVVPPPEDPDLQREVEALRHQLAGVRATLAAWRYPDAREGAVPLVERARATGYAPVIAEALFALAGAQRGLRDATAAEATLRDAAWHALAGRHDRVLFESWAMQIEILGRYLHRPEEGLRSARRAKAVLQRLGGTPRDSARLERMQGLLHVFAGRHEVARSHFLEDLALREAAFGPESLDAAQAVNNVGSILEEMGQLEEALPWFERAYQTKLAVLGPHHPDVARSLSGRANTLQRLGRYEESLAEQTRALQIVERAVGPRSALAATHHLSLSTVHTSRGDHESAIEHGRIAISINEEIYGPDHPEVAKALTNVGVALDNIQRHREARDLNARALAIAEKALPPEHPMVAVQLNNLANSYEALGDFEEALSMYERALAVGTAAQGADHRSNSYPAHGVGNCLLALERPAEAVPHLERALKIRREVEGNPVMLGETEFALGRARWEAGDDGPAARALVEAARDHYAQAGHVPEREAAARRWLDEHDAGDVPPPPPSP